MQRRTQPPTAFLSVLRPWASPSTCRLGSSTPPTLMWAPFPWCSNSSLLERVATREMLHHAYPILEFDSTPEAVIEPRRFITPIDAPEHAVVCFFQDVITRLSQHHQA